MIIRFWGVRGSIPAPHKDTIRYGGNTACVELRNENNDILIIDAGTGIRRLGNSLLSEFKGRQINALILLSHTHWDHIQGLPFFVPLYIPNNSFRFVAPAGTKRELREIFNLQMDHDFFPLNFDGLPSRNSYNQVCEEEFDYNGYNIKTKVLNHGGLGSVLGFKITADNKTVIYSSDHEGYELFFKSGTGKTQKIIENMEAKYRTFLEGADFLIHDAQYDSQDYLKKKGWGHSSFDYVINTAMLAGLKKVSFIHYDPDYTDDRIDAIIAEQRKFLTDNKIENLEIIPSYEGLEIKL